MSGTLAALALGLAFAASTDPHEGWPITPEESAAIDAEHARIAAPFPAVFKKVEEMWMSYPRAKDPDAHLAEWDRLFDQPRKDIERFQELAEEHKRLTDALQVRLVTRAMTNAASGVAVSDAPNPDFIAIQKTKETILTRNGTIMSRWWDEVYRLDDARTARAAMVKRAADDRAMGLWAVAGLALLFGFGYAVRRLTAVAPDALILASPPSAAAIPAPQAVPTLIGGNIDVVRPIGRGGMGEVYEGLDRTLQRKVALKRLRPELTGNASDLSRLLNEARLVAALKHPNIVAIHSVEKEAGQVFLVFEYVDGPTLATFISQRKQVAWPEALRVFQGAAAALHAAHGQKIVHRDLKPGNIMLDSKGVVKVMDFGIAHEAARVVSRLTSSGAWGTPPYMSPEQELGEVNTGVDLFALNVCFYEMLTGELPFTGPNFLAQKREKFYVPISKAVPVLPKALDAFFATAFDPDPAKRFQDAATLSAAAGALA